MTYRRDALAGAAELVLLVERIARDSGGTLVGTVGRIAAQPGAVNIIPGRGGFTGGPRGMGGGVRGEGVAQREAEAWGVGGARGLEGEGGTFHAEGAGQCAPARGAALG